MTRDERRRGAAPTGTFAPGNDLPISLSAYDRAFDAKLRLEAARCTNCGTLSYPPSLSVHRVRIGAADGVGAAPPRRRDLHAGDGACSGSRAHQPVHADTGRARRLRRAAARQAHRRRARFGAHRRSRHDSCSGWWPCARACPTTATASCRTNRPRRRRHAARRLRHEARGDGRGRDDRVRRAVRARHQGHGADGGHRGGRQRRQGFRPLRHRGRLVRRARHHRRVRHRHPRRLLRAARHPRARDWRTPARPATTPCATA